MRDLRLNQKLTLLTALVGATASLVACLSFILFDLYTPREQGLAQLIERDLGIVALVLLVSSLVSMVVVSRFRRMISDPVMALAEAVNRMTTDESYSERLEKLGEDEVGSLVDSFNQMLEAVRTRERRVKISEERYALAVQGSNDAIWDHHLKSGETYFSERLAELLGGPLPDSLEQWWLTIYKDDREAVRASFEEALADPERRQWQHEYRIERPDGELVWVLNRAALQRDAQGKCQRVAGSQSDITQQRRAEDQLKHDAFHDTLTGLPNRALFFDRLGRSIERIRRHPDQLFAVLFLDLDGFKNINDSLGHLVGDQLLVEIANRLTSVVRLEDTVARLGGDEFTILLEELSETSDVIRVADRVHAVLKKPFDLGGNQFFPTTSIGIALSSSGYERPEDLLRDADTAMYRAKQGGKATHRIFDLEMHKQAVSRLQLESGLRRAVDNQEFVAYYQPVIDLESGRIAGFEALVRWQHPEHGLLLPGEFIQTAEDCGYISAIGEFVLREACRQLTTWSAGHPDLLMSVNISARQFEQPDLVDKILGILEETKAPPRQLRLEVTESALIRDYNSAIDILARLKDVEIQFYLDDFGTGYSSLNHLRQFQFNTLKIDRSFVSTMMDNQENRKIVETVVALAHNLGMRTVGEGVERPEQMRALRDLGCQFAQGFLFSKAVAAEQATTLLSEGPCWS